MTRGRNERKRTDRRLRKEMRWWNEDCPASVAGHVPKAYSVGDAIKPRVGTIPRIGRTAVCEGCARLIERDVVVHQPKARGLEGQIVTSPWRSRPYMIEEEP